VQVFLCHFRGLWTGPRGARLAEDSKRG